MTVKQHAVKTDEDPVSDFAWSVHNGAVGDGTEFANGDRSAGFGVDHHTILQIGVGSYDNRLHVSLVIYLIGPDHHIGTNEDILLDDHLAADDGGLVDIGGFINDWQMPGRVFADHVTSLNQHVYWGIRVSGYAIPQLMNSFYWSVPCSSGLKSVVR